MPKIHQHQLSEILISLPEIQSFDTNCQSIEKESDLFLCVLGFEHRSLTILENLVKQNHKTVRAVYFEYGTNRIDNSINRPKLIHLLESITDSINSLEADEHEFSQRLRELLQSITRKTPDKAPVVFFDISVGANRLILRCLKILLEFKINLKIFYSEAAVYHPTIIEYQQNPQAWEKSESLGLEHGISDVCVSEEYPGIHTDQLPHCVILFPSFSKERSLAVISEVDPLLLQSPSNKVIWLLGIPHLIEDHWRLEAMYKINGLKDTYTQHSISTFNYKETLMVLDSIYQEREENHKFTLSPMGSKLQAIGISLFCYLHPDIRVVFATPNEYNPKQYSDGCKATWIIDFGSIEEIRNLLDMVGTIEIEYEKRPENT